MTTAGNDMEAMRCAGLSMPHAGFTLVELMVTLAIAAILLAVGMPNFSGIIKNQEIQAAARDFLAALNLARSEAIRRNTRVDLIPAQDGTDWGKGWVIFVDHDNNLKPDKDDEIIFTHGPVPAHLTIESKLTDASAKYITYNGQGRTRTNKNDQQPQTGNVTLTFDNQIRKININFLGRARICNPGEEPSTC